MSRAEIRMKKTSGGHQLQECETPPLYVHIGAVMAYMLLFIVGQIEELFSVYTVRKIKRLFSTSKYIDPLTSFAEGFDSLYLRRVYIRCADVFSRPVTNTPGRLISVLERVSVDRNRNFKLTGRKIECLNLGSYNYLGFSQHSGPVSDSVEKCIRVNGIALASSTSVCGSTELLQETEKLVAKFVRAEDAVIIGIGFATNSTVLPAIVGPGCLSLSDELNHSSLAFGLRVSGTKTRVFRHRDINHIEEIIREEIINGQPGTDLPWKKIVLFAEGLYSMEGTMCPIREYIELKKKYKLYLYVDEAHSMGALGKSGRGICDHFGVDPGDIDVLMGTFTKSFGSVGGYIAGSKDLIKWVRTHCHSSIYGDTISFPALQQIKSSLHVIMGDINKGDGERRIRRLAENSRYFSSRLKELGFIIYGDDGSPVVPLLIYHPVKLAAFSRGLLMRGIASVVVGYPATSLVSARARFCLSSSHEREDLDCAIEAIKEMGDILGLRVSRRTIKSSDIQIGKG